MKDNELIASHLSPRVQIFIESLLNADTRRNRHPENSMDSKKGSRKAKQSETKSPR